MKIHLFQASKDCSKVYESYDLCEVTVRANLVSKVKLMLEARDPINTFTEFEAFVEEVFAEISNFSKFAPEVGEEPDIEIAPDGEDMVVEGDNEVEDRVEEIGDGVEEIDSEVEEIEIDDEVEEIEDEMEDEEEEIEEMGLEERRVWRREHAEEEEIEDDVTEQMVWGRGGGLDEEDDYLVPSPKSVPIVPGLHIAGPSISTAWKLPPGGRFVDVEPRHRDSQDMVDGEHDEELDFRNGETIS